MVALVVAVGALVQGVLGFGLALLSVPVLAWVAPEFVPEGVLVAVLPLVAASAWRERGDVDGRGLVWALAGRVPGGLVGGVLVAVLSLRGLQTVVALSVLAAVAVSAVGSWRRRRASRGPAGHGPEAGRDAEPEGGPGAGSDAGAGAGSDGGPDAGDRAGSEDGSEAGLDGGPGTGDRAMPPAPARPQAGTLVAAGALSGLSATVSAIGGPPMALVYRRQGGPTLRATLSLFFLAGSLASLATLAIVGELDASGVGAGLLLLPAVAAGYLASGPARRLVDTGWLGPAVLVASGGASSALLAQAVLG